MNATLDTLAELLSALRCDDVVCPDTGACPNDCRACRSCGDGYVMGSDDVCVDCVEQQREEVL